MENKASLPSHSRDQITSPQMNSNRSIRDTRSTIFKKTEHCIPWVETGKCKFGNTCDFAHGQTDLRGRVYRENYKTVLCSNLQKKGSCRFDSRCKFLHKEIIVFCNGMILYFSPNNIVRVETEIPTSRLSLMENVIRNQQQRQPIPAMALPPLTPATVPLDPVCLTAHQNAANDLFLRHINMQIHQQQMQQQLQQQQLQQHQQQMQQQQEQLQKEEQEQLQKMEKFQQDHALYWKMVYDNSAAVAAAAATERDG